MKDVTEMTHEELQTEVLRLRKAVPERCPTCRRWAVYTGAYDEDGYTLRCHGCLRSIGKCTCR